MIGEEASASSWKETSPITKESFMKLLAKISLLVSPKQNSPNYKLLFCKHLIRLLILTSVHLERACEVTIFIFLKNKQRIRACVVSNFHPAFSFLQYNFIACFDVTIVFDID